jgi:hypothetical protein
MGNEFDPGTARRMLNLVCVLVFWVVSVIAMFGFVVLVGLLAITLTMKLTGWGFTEDSYIIRALHHFIVR